MALPKRLYGNRQVPQRANPNDKDVISELLARQDGVIGELDKLEAEILGAIESLNAVRREQLESGTSTVDQPNVLKLKHPDQDADDGQSSRAA